MSQAVGRNYAGQSADERDAQRRARLLAALRELVGTTGYAATKIERICTLANVSTRHFYVLYDGKESAFIDLYDGLTQESYEHVIASLAETEGRPIADRVAHAFAAYLQPMFDDVRTARIQFVEIVGVSQRIEQLRLQYRETLIAMIESEGGAAVARGEIKPRDFRFAALALIGAATVIVHDWASAPRRTPAAVVQRQLIDLAVTLFAG